MHVPTESSERDHVSVDMPSGLLGPDYLLRFFHHLDDMVGHGLLVLKAV